MTDPGDGNGRVEHLAIIREAIAGRDAIPLGRSRYDLRTGAVEPLDDL